MKWKLPTSAEIQDSLDGLSYIENGMWTRESSNGSDGFKSSEAVYLNLKENLGPQSVYIFIKKNFVICISEKVY